MFSIKQKEKHSKPDFCEKSIAWKKWVWVYCVWVCGVWFLGKIQGFGFAVYGLPGEEVDRQGRKRGLRAPST